MDNQVTSQTPVKFAEFGCSTTSTRLESFNSCSALKYYILENRMAYWPLESFVGLDFIYGSADLKKPNQFYFCRSSVSIAYIKFP